MSDELLEAALEHWSAIQTMYEQFAEDRPVMLFVIQEGRVNACPYSEFRKELGDRSRRLLKQQYRHAINEDGIVVFVRDDEQRRLVSFVMTPKQD
jgi:hypothetical protein